jgi:hypothetical protein
MNIRSLIHKFENNKEIEYNEFIPKHKGLKSPYNHKPNNYQHQIIIASMCGDGSLAYPYKERDCNPRIQWNLGNKEHALFKFRAFDEFIGAKYTERENPGFGSNWFCVSTKSHFMLNEYIEKYGERKKNVKVDSGIFDELDDIGWAWLYGDDGHMAKRGSAYIHTESFCFEDVQKIRESLNAFLGFDGARVHSYIGGKYKREMHCIRLTVGGTNEFIEKIKGNMANGLEYKISYGDGKK